MTAIDEAKKALEGVTPGPWENVSYQSGTVQVLMRSWNNAKPDPMRDGSMYGYMSAYMIAYNIGWQNENDIDRERQANARFIAWAREGVPALLAEIAAKDAEIAAKDAEIARMRGEFIEATDENFIWGAMDNVHDAETTMDDYAAAVSRAQRAALARVKGGAA